MGVWDLRRIGSAAGQERQGEQILKKPIEISKKPTDISKKPIDISKKTYRNLKASYRRGIPGGVNSGWSLGKPGLAGLAGIGGPEGV